MTTRKPITSASNSTVKRIRKLLSSPKYRRAESAFVVEGLKSCRMLFDPGWKNCDIDTLILSQSFAESPEAESFIASLGDARLVVMDDSLMDRVADARTSQGVMAIAQFQPLPDPALDEPGRYLLLDRIMDPGNMGSLIRTAVGTGMDGIFLYGDNVDIYNPKCVRATAGTLPFTPIWQTDDEMLAALLGKGFDIYATIMEAEESIFDLHFGEKTVVAIGNEAQGLSDAVKSRATRSVAIPLSPPCESLNAAVAGSLVMLSLKRGFGPR